MMLGDLAHARAGDKGDTSIIMVAPFAQSDFQKLGEIITPNALARHFGTEVRYVDIFALPALSAYTVVFRSQLGGGVTRSLRADPHGKTLASHLLMLEVSELLS